MEISALSIGVDIATSVAIVGSAVTFMYNQRRQNKTEAVMKLHEQVRTISIQQLQEELETLSRQYTHQIIAPTQKILNIGRLSHRLLEQDAPPERAREVLIDSNRFEETQRSIADLIEQTRLFIKEVHAAKYRIFPVLYNLREGAALIQEYRECSEALIEASNQLGPQHTSLMKETLAFTQVLGASGEDQQALKMQWLRMAFSIAQDDDYRSWVDLFIEDGKEPAYWEAMGASDIELKQELCGTVALRIMRMLEQDPGRAACQQILMVHKPAIALTTQAKRLLVLLSASIAWLSCKAEDRTSDTMEQLKLAFASKELLALESELY